MYCAHCGAELRDGELFCAQCGTRADDFTDKTDVSQPAAATAGSSGGAVAAADKLNWKIVGPVLAVAIAAVALVLVFALQGNATGGKTAPAKTTGAPITLETPRVKVDGKEIVALARPALVAYAAEDESSGAALSAGVPALSVDSNLDNVLYANDLISSSYFSEERKLLADKGFVVSYSAYDEFFERYEQNRYNKFPSFVTTDSMMHTYHLFFSHLLKNTERTYLASALADTSRAMLQASEDQLAQLQGTEWENAAKRNAAFFAVGTALLDPNAPIPESVAPVVNEELSLVRAAGQASTSPLLGYALDYTQFLVRGYYEGDEVLEPYFRAMMWYGQATFLQEDDKLGDDLDRSALLMTLALDSGALAQWEQIYTVTSFFAGASDDCSYYEYKPLFDAAYGEGAGVGDLAGNDGAWKSYHAMTAQMRAPQINSVIGESDGDAGNDEDKGYRFMGQRFTIDAAIFQHLIYDDVESNPQGQNRLLPNALDVPAALGSDEALSILQEEGETKYAGYEENLGELRDTFANAPDELWNASLYSQWLHTLDPLLEQKGDGWPTFMQSKEWARKSLECYLGSYTELKHDTVLYAKQAMAEAGGMIDRTDDRGYVEPEPELYRRLANMAKATSEGLAGFDMIGAEDAQSMARLQELSSKLQAISEKELRNEALSDDEYELIRSYGVQLEHFWEEAHAGDSNLANITHWDFPAAVVTDVASSAEGEVLELGCGRPSVIYVVVPVDGQLRLATGSVFSFYQFDWPASQRLTDSTWREMMGFVNPLYGKVTTTDSIKPEEWTQSFTVTR